MDLAPDAYDTLRRIAASYLERERAGHTLQPTALVHEAFIRLSDGSYADESHFRAAAATAMRRILVDHARARGADKRGGGRLHITLVDGVTAEEPDIDLLALDEAIRALSGLSARRARVVELRFFGGMTAAEIGATLGIATKTADADWYFARAWLRKRLDDGDRP